MSDPAPQYPEILDDFAVKAAECARAEGIDAATAERIGWRTAEMIRREYGGAKHYIPRGTSHAVALVRRQIFLRWDGTNTRELCREFDLSEERLRQLHAEARAERDGGKPAPAE